MNLKQELSLLRDRSSAMIDAPSMAIMNRSTDEIRQRIEQRALRLGDVAPNFRLIDAHGASVELDELLARGPVVLSFYRGDWCPFCNLELRAFQDRLSQFAALGAQLVAISPQMPDHSLVTATKNALDFPVLSDIGLHVARAYGLAFDFTDDLRRLYLDRWKTDLVSWNGDGGWSLPVPATFVIGKDARVLFAHIDPDFRERSDPDEVLAALRR